MATKKDLEGIHYRDGTVVLAGRKSTASFDAALFLTTMRLACSADDPFFSLDPPDPAAWDEQSTLAMDAVWSQVKNQFEARHHLAGLHTISVRRDLGQAWQQLARHYPALESKLVVLVTERLKSVVRLKSAVLLYALA